MDEEEAKYKDFFGMDEGKREIGLMAAILVAMHMQRADDLFGMPNGAPVTDRVIEASIQWVQRMMHRIDSSIQNRSAS